MASALLERMNTPRVTLGSLITASILSGCVAREKYDAALNDATRARAELGAYQKFEKEARGETRAEIAQLRRDLAEAQVSLASAQQEVEFAGGIAITCGEALDEATTFNEGLRAELERLGKDVSALGAAKAELTGSLSQARAGLDELRSAQAASDAQAALYRDIATRLERMLDSGELDIGLRSGRMVLLLPADVLFEPGKAKVGERGIETLTKVGQVLGTVKGRRFQVSGHTDADPIRFSAFASNWQLSSARALEVVDILLRSGVSPAVLSAAGYAEFDPIVPNDSPTNKAKNRRIEITLQPNIDQLVDVPHG
jgi:chemotaxis protein MotB